MVIHFTLLDHIHSKLFVCIFLRRSLWISERWLISVDEIFTQKVANIKDLDRRIKYVEYLGYEWIWTIHIVFRNIGCDFLLKIILFQLLFLDSLLWWIRIWTLNHLLWFFDINMVVLSRLKLHWGTNKFGSLVILFNFKSKIFFISGELYQKWEFFTTEEFSLYLVRAQIKVENIIFSIQFGILVNIWSWQRWSSQ